MSGDCGHGWGYHKDGPSGPCSKCEQEAKVTYALKSKKGFSFICTASTLQACEKKVQSSFNDWLGAQARGSNKTINDFLEGYELVKVAIEKL